MKTVSTVQENAEDIYAGAKQINEDRAAAEEEFISEDEFEDEESEEANAVETEAKDAE